MALKRITNPGQGSIAGLKKKGYKRAGGKPGGKTVYVLKTPAAKTPKAPTTKTSTTTPAAKPVDPYAQYDSIPGARAGIKRLDAQALAHQDYAKDIAAKLAGTINPLAENNANAQRAYAALAGQYAQQGALPSALPNVAVGGGAVTPGLGGVAQRQQRFLGEGVAAGGTQDASYGGFMSETQGRGLAAGILGSIGEYSQRLPGIYNAQKNDYLAKLDNVLLESAQAAAELQQELQIENSRQETDRYKARLGLVGNLTGTQAKLSLGQLDAETDAADRTSRETVAASNQRSRESIAQLNAETKVQVARYNGQIQLLKSKATKSGAKSADKVKLLRGVQDAFDKLWAGEEGDQIKGTKGYGWRFTARAGAGGREKAAQQVIAWLQGTGLGPQNIHRLFKSKGFSDAEFQRAVARIESGKGVG